MTTDQTPSTSKRPWLLAALPAITFILGAVIGGIIVGVGAGSSDSGSDASETPTSTSSPAAPSPSDTTVVVPAACREAADAVTQAADLLRQGAAAVRDFQPKVLNQVLDDLQALDPELQSLAKECSEVQVTTGSASP
jgi:hypothetical protein